MRTLPISTSRRDWLRRTAAVAGAATLAGCARRSGTHTPRTLRFWALGRESEVVQELLPDFEREHPGLTVRVEQLPFTAAHEKLLTSFAGDSTPDVAQLGNTWVPEFAALNALMPLDAWIASAKAVDPTDYFDGIWRTNVIDGQAFGVPWYVDTRLLFYRRDLWRRAGFDRMPSDWTTFSSALDALQRLGIKHPLYLPLNEFEQLLALCLQQSESLLRDDGRYGNFRSSGFKKALGYYTERFHRGHAAAVDNNQIGNLHQEFGRGTFAAYISGPWNIGELDRRLGIARRNDWGTAPLPGPDGPGASNAGGSSLVVFRRTRRQDDALALLGYLSRPAVQLRFHALIGDLPPRRSAWSMQGADGSTLAQEPRAIAFAQQLERARPTPPVPEWERIVQEMQLVAWQAVKKHIPLDDAAALIDHRVDGFLEKRRWMMQRAAKA